MQEAWAACVMLKCKVEWITDNLVALNMREVLPTDPLELLTRYKDALERIRKVAEEPEKHPELVRANKLHVYMWQLADDALDGQSLCPGG